MTISGIHVCSGDGKEGGVQLSVQRLPSNKYIYIYMRAYKISFYFYNPVRV